MSIIRQRRIMIDIQKLISNGYELYFSAGGTDEVFVIFPGPEDSFYSGGIWKLRLRFPPQYPYKGPLISFVNNIFHPNIEGKSGTICLNLLGVDWNPIYDLLNVINEFIPELLRNPNDRDPYNTEASKLLTSNLEGYKKYIREHIKKNASSLVALIPQKEELQTNCNPFDMDEDDDDVYIV